MTGAVALADFRAASEEFLASRYGLRVEPGQAWGSGSDRIAIFPEQTPEEDKADLAAAKDHRRARAAAGFGWIDGAVEYGGAGLSAAHAKAYAEAESRYAVPPMGTFTVTDGMVIPGLVASGTEAAKKALLRPLVQGDLVACQLFSEPEAGSDLAAVRTRAERDGDRWSVSGQKVWSSAAHLADIGLLLARTGPAGARHRSLTMFLVDMGDPGVLVRPLRQMTGGSSFNEVFLDGVVVPDEMRLGEVDGGWAVAMTTLRHERSTVGEMGWLMMGCVDRLRALVANAADRTDPQLRQQVATAWSHARLAELTVARALARMQADEAPGPEASVLKLSMSENLRRVAAAASTALGPRLVADAGEWGTYAWAEFVLSSPAMRIAAGTDEIQRNTIAERVLGLPRTPDA